MPQAPERPPLPSAEEGSWREYLRRMSNWRHTFDAWLFEFNRRPYDWRRDGI